MACARPVVSTHLETGVDYINQDGVTGLVVPPQNALALGEALNQLLDQPDLSTRLGRQGRERVEREFTKKMMAEKTFSLYRDLLKE